MAWFVSSECIAGYEIQIHVDVKTLLVGCVQVETQDFYIQLVKVGFLYSATYMVDQEQRALTISEVAVDWQEPVVLQHKCGCPLLAQKDIWPAVAASKHTTAPINHTRPSPS